MPATPAVIGVSPADLGIGVGVQSKVSVTFNTAMDPTTITAGTFQVRVNGGAPLAGRISYNSVNHTAAFDSNTVFPYHATVAATVVGGPNGVKSSTATPMAGNFSSSFTTALALEQGPGGPILVITSPANPYTTYIPEILRGEGLNEFLSENIGAVTAASLAAHGVVILGDMTLTAAQVNLLTTYVDNGGNLIAMHPDPQLNTLLGIQAASGPLTNAYLKIDTTAGPGVGITDQTIQFHGPARAYHLNGATAVATLYSTATAATSQPAVTLRDVGTHGGRAAAFAFDLARSVALTRQGNPAWSGQFRDQDRGLNYNIMSHDLFYGPATFDPEPNWNDFTKIEIPQADEQQRLLANLVTDLSRKDLPLPRFWYLPNGAKALIAMTGDDHGGAGTVGRFNQYLADGAIGGQPVRSTSNLVIVNGGWVTDQQAQTYTADGFEVSLHETVNTTDNNCGDVYGTDALIQLYANEIHIFESQFPGIPAPETTRFHCIAWTSYDLQPMGEFPNRIRLDTNYYYYPDYYGQDRPGLFTGSGFPQRFTSLTGSTIDVYQAATQMTDQSAFVYPFISDTLLANATGPKGYYGIFTVIAHTDTAASAVSDAVIASARRYNVAVESAQDVLNWLDGRNGSQFNGLSWNGTASTLSFSVAPGDGANGLEAMLPVQSAQGPLATIQRGAATVPFTVQAIKGVDYAFFSATAGSYTARYTRDTSAPQNAQLQAVAVSGQSAQLTWITNKPSDSVVLYGTSPTALTRTASDPVLTTNHSVTLTGLTANATYYYRVQSTDRYGNTSTDPLTPGAPDSFVAAASPRKGDTSQAGFQAGTTGANTFVSKNGTGEVILKPALAYEFPGTALPSGWSGTAWAAGGTATVSGGELTVNGARAGTTAQFTANRSVEFVATFSGDHDENVGFGIDFTDFTNSPYAVFSTFTGGSLYARTGDNTEVPDQPNNDTLIPGNWLGAPHLFRIEWDTNLAKYWIDNLPVAVLPAPQLPAPQTTTMHFLVSDRAVGGGAVTVSWVRQSLYPASGTYASQVFDAGHAVTWTAATWADSLPAGTSLAFLVRMGNTATPNGTWTSFIPVPASGSQIGGSSRYIQFEAVLQTTDADVSPALRSANLFYQNAADTIAPRVVSVSPAPGGTAVATNSNVLVRFSELMNASTITTTTFTLRAQGAAQDVAATVSYAGSQATLHPKSALTAGTIYQATLSGNVTDSSGNKLGSNLVWTFTTAGTGPHAGPGSGGGGKNDGVQPNGPSDLAGLVAASAGGTAGNLSPASGLVAPGSSLADVSRGGQELASAAAEDTAAGDRAFTPGVAAPASDPADAETWGAIPALFPEQGGVTNDERARDPYFAG